MKRRLWGGCILGLMLNEAVCSLGNTYRCQTKHLFFPTPPLLLSKNIHNPLKQRGKENPVLLQYSKVLFNSPTQSSPVCFHTLCCSESRAEGHLSYRVEIFSCWVRYCPGFSRYLIKWPFAMMMIASACICNVYGHQVFPSERVSPGRVKHAPTGRQRKTS